MDVSTEISAASFLIAGIALWKSFATDRRDREAVVSVAAIWEGRIVASAAGSAATLEMPQKPSERYVIAPAPTIYERIVVRRAEPSDDADLDRTHYSSFHVFVEVKNVGRSAAEKPVINGRIIATMFDPVYKGKVIERDFPFELRFTTLDVVSPLYVEFRNMIAIQLDLTFDSVACAGGQPARLVSAPVRFDPRG